MSSAKGDCYAGRFARVNLSSAQVQAELVDRSELRRYVGGTGLGASYLYREVAPGTGWDDPDNCLIFASGPLGGTRLAGAGSFSVVTKGPLTNGGTSSQANGYFGAFVRFSGFDGIVVRGVAEDWSYLYIHDGKVELRDARHLVGMDSWETELAIKKELGKGERELSVFGIGPAGENLVRFAAIVGDRGHVAAHNGVGAVMGSKRLKAVAAARRGAAVPVSDKEGFSALARDMIEQTKNHPLYSLVYKYGSSVMAPRNAAIGVLPVKNMTTNLFPDPERFSAEDYRQRHHMKWTPCWACPMRHCHTMTIKEGPYAGCEGDEPEYEAWAAFGPLIGQTDIGAALMLSDLTDRLGMDCNETGWLLSFVMECYESGVLTRNDLDGLEMTWGNAEAARALLQKTARREGIGNVLADGVKRSAEAIGGRALEIGAYIKKGHAPRGHDHRARWTEILDYATSGTGTIESGPIPVAEPFNPKAVAAAVAGGKIRLFVDSLVTCMFPTRTMVESSAPHMVPLLNAATGWDFTYEEACTVALRIANLLRVFNLRHGVGAGPDVEAPSTRYGSAPVDGPVKGISIMPSWEPMLDEYYALMGWDRSTGQPLPKTLKDLGLGECIADLEAGRQGNG